MNVIDLQEYGVIQFEFDSGGPSRIGAWVPAVSGGGLPVVWQPTTDEDSIETAVEVSICCRVSLAALVNHVVADSTRSQKGFFDRLTGLQNKRPKWDEVHGGHVLNFQGRVTESSVKNFQLCSLDTMSGL